MCEDEVGDINCGLIERKVQEEEIVVLAKHFFFPLTSVSFFSPSLSLFYSHSVYLPHRMPMSIT
jgi:hypothetical protein